jgi:hypothetical protein
MPRKRKPKPATSKVFKKRLSDIQNAWSHGELRFLGRVINEDKDASDPYTLDPGKIKALGDAWIKRGKELQNGIL